MAANTFKPIDSYGYFESRSWKRAITPQVPDIVIISLTHAKQM